MFSALRSNAAGLVSVLLIAVPAWFLGNVFPLMGGAVIGILAGMLLAPGVRRFAAAAPGIKFVSRKVLQWAVILLGFGLNLGVVLKTGAESLPIIVTTIATSLIVAWLLQKVMKIPGKTATLIGVGSSICGGSAIAAAAPAVDANDSEIAQSISVIFFFNVMAALVFPPLGAALGFTHDPNAFGIFAGTAVNDTSSVTATAATWDSMWGLGTATLDKAVTVKLTRTLAIIPIVLGLTFLRLRRERTEGAASGKKTSLRKAFPMFILWFVVASLITTVCTGFFDVSTAAFTPAKVAAKFMIVMAMTAIGLNTDLIKLVKTGGKPILLGFCCWAAITGVSLLMQHLLGLW